MSTISKFLAKPPDQFSTQISSATVSSTDLSVNLDDTSGLPTEGIGQFFKKDANGDLVSGSVEFVHWTNVSGNTITFSDTGDRGITGSDSGAQSYVADDYFEVWVTSYYVDGGDTDHNSDGTHVTASSAEITTGTDTDKLVTPDAFAGSAMGTRVVSIIIFDDSTEVTTGDGAGDMFYRVPSIINGYNLVAVAAQNQTAATGTGTETTDIMIYNVTQTADMLSVALTIDEDEKDSSTAATAVTIDTNNDDVATGDQLRFDVDAVPSTTGGNGLIVELQFRAP